MPSPSSSSTATRGANRTAGRSPATPRPLLTLGQARAAFVFTLLVLVATALFEGDGGGVLQAVADLRFSGIGPRSLLTFGGALLAAMIGYLVLGVLAVASLCTDGAAATRLQRLRARALSLLAGGSVAGFLAWCVAGVSSVPIGWHAPGLFEAFLPLSGATLGALFGDLPRCPAGRALAGFAWRLVGLAVVAALLLTWLRNLLLAPMPLDLPTARITSIEKRELVDLARVHNPLRVATGERTVLALSPEQLQAGLAWATTVFDPTARARVSTAANTALPGSALRLETSLRVGGRFLNVDAELAGRLTGAELLRITHCRLRLGAIELHGSRCEGIVREVHSLLAHQAALASAFAALHVLSIDGEGMVARYGALSLDPNAKGTMRRLLGPSPAVRAGVAAQVAMLRSQARGLVASPDPFASVLRASFELARARSGASAPALENQAAILALAGLLGHHDVFAVSGLERPDDHDDIRQSYARVRLRGREDWRRHFLVSAALTQVSNTLMSDAAGLLKEELDAGGTSGFSFSDLLMDRAGTLFGETAVRNGDSARELQALIIDGYDVDHIAPPAGDLPENLDDESLQVLYGGVGGPGYRTLLGEIERRVRAARAYRSPATN